MKTRTFFMLILLICIGLKGLQAQNIDPTSTKSFQGWYQSTYWSPVYCGEQFKEYLEGGTISVHYIVHYKNGKYQWETDQIKGEVKSQSGETFIISELDKTYFTDHWYLTWRFNLKGDRGTHYIGTLTYSYWTGETTVVKAVCPGDDI